MSDSTQPGFPHLFGLSTCAILIMPCPTNYNTVQPVSILCSLAFYVRIVYLPYQLLLYVTDKPHLFRRLLSCPLCSRHLRAAAPGLFLRPLWSLHVNCLLSPYTINFRCFLTKFLICTYEHGISSYSGLLHSWSSRMWCHVV